MCIRNVSRSPSASPSPIALQPTDETHYTALFALTLRITSAVIGVLAIIHYMATLKEKTLLTIGGLLACYVISWLIEPPGAIAPLQSALLQRPVVAVAGASRNFRALSPPFSPKEAIATVPVLELEGSQQESTPPPTRARSTRSLSKKAASAAAHPPRSAKAASTHSRRKG